MTGKDEWSNAVEINSATNSETWDKNSGDLIGLYLGAKHDIGDNHSSIYNVKTDDGTVFGAWGSAVLDNKMSEVEVGSRVKIAFLGKVENPKTKRTYNDYSVMVKAPEVSEGGIVLAGIPFGE